MASRHELIYFIKDVLDGAGFATSDPKDLLHAGFDIVARRDSLILIIKVSMNADSINERAVASMSTLSHLVDGSPIIVSVKTGKSRVEDGVVYTRAHIPLLSPQTLVDLVVEGVPPLVYAASGGFYTRVDADVLKRVREGGMSLGDLAEYGGVSRRSIKMYEDGMSAKLDIALRLEERLGVELILPVNPLSLDREEGLQKVVQGSAEGLAREVFDKLHSIGYLVDQTRRCPFDAVAHDKKVVLFTGIDMRKQDLHRRAKAICNLSKILEKHSVIFVDKLGERVNLEGAPLIATKELSKIEDKKHMIELVEERG